jgi:hypothetical protein
MIAVGLIMLFAIQTPAAQQPAAPGTVTVEQNLNIPDEIAPAIIPYVNCRVSSQGVPMRNERGETLDAVVPPGGDCTPHRKQAAARANAMLKQYTDLSRMKRRDLIENTLNSIDKFTSWRTAPQTEKQPDASNR